MAAAVKLRALLNGRLVAEGQAHRFADETLASVGALALLLPGFLSDAFGLLLAVPAVRDRLADRLASGKRATNHPPDGGQRPGSAPQTIDLAPGEWRHDGTVQQPSPKG